MAAYEVFLSSSVRHDVSTIERIHLARIMTEVRSLADNPFPPGCKKLKGSKASYRIRAGDYRILYEVDTEGKVVTIYRIRHRGDVYRR